MEFTNEQKEMAKQYKQITNRTLEPTPDGKVQYIENRSTGVVKQKRSWGDIKKQIEYWNNKRTSITTSSNKNIVKKSSEKYSEGLNVNNIFADLQKPKKEKFANASCSIKISEYKQLQDLVKQNNTTINKLLQKFIRNLLSNSYK